MVLVKKIFLKNILSMR